MSKIKMIGRFLLALLPVGTAGCSEHDPTDRYVTIVPTIRSRATALAFEPGDRIGLTIVRTAGRCADNRPMTYDGSLFAGDVEWYAEREEPSTLIAYYPYSAAGLPPEFAIGTDQRDGCGASDLLGAVRTEVLPGSTPVGMVFRHLMTQLTLRIDNRTASPVETVVLAGFANAAEIDSETLAVTVAKNAPVSEVLPCEVQTATYRAVLVPQRADLTVAVGTADGTVHRKRIEGVALESGVRYDLSMQLTAEGVKIVLSGEIRDWIDGGAIGSGEPGEGEDPGGDLVYEGETYATVVLGGRRWMAENLRCEPPTATWNAGMRYPADGISGAAEKGLLYDLATAAGDDALYGQQTPVRGICPPGWHIPLRSELETLLSSESGCEESFFCISGCWIEGVPSQYGTASYLMSTTLTAQNTQMYCLRIRPDYSRSVVAVPVKYGVSVRCVQDE